MNERRFFRVFRGGMIGLLLFFLGEVATAQTPLPTQGMAAICSVESVHTDARKIMLVVSGQASLLLAKQADAEGNAQAVRVPLEHTVIVLGRTHEVYAAEADWADAVRRFRALAGRTVHLETVAPRLAFSDGALEEISATRLRVAD
jgi:hypothetical protein